MPGIKLSTARSDGRLQVTFSQSWLNTFMECPEQARREMAGTLPYSPTDATAIGTGVHAGIEHVLKREDGNPLDAAIAAFDAEVQHINFRWVQVKKKDTAYSHIQQALDAWATHIFPQLGEPIGIEEPFRLFLCSGEDRGVPWVAYIEGTWDAEFADGLWDWKTAGDERKYKDGFGGEGWKLKRWAIQPTVYTLALATKYDDFSPKEFTYAAMVKGTDTCQVLNVQRDESHWAWLREQVASVMALIVSDVDPWPLNDHSALCSPKWCMAWPTCKGAYVTAV